MAHHELHPDTRAARDAAIGVVRAHGIAFDNAILIRDTSNVLIHFRPCALVARIAGHTAALRKGDAWFGREARLAAALHRAGAPVVPPSDLLPSGPHHHAGRIITFWPYIRIHDREPRPEEIGRTLRACHEVLADLDFDFPEMGCWREAIAIFQRLCAEDVLQPERIAVLATQIERLDTIVATLDAPFHIVHGDAGYGNVLACDDGLLWTDWEDTQRAPVAWDLAALMVAATITGERTERARAALAGYGSLPDRDLLDLFVQLRAVQTSIWMAHLARFYPAIEPRLERWIAWLRDL